MDPKVIIHDIRQILRDTSEISHIHILQIIEDHTNFTFFSKINNWFNEELSNCDTSRLNSKSNSIRGGLIYLGFLDCYQLYLYIRFLYLWAAEMWNPTWWRFWRLRHEREWFIFWRRSPERTRSSFLGSWRPAKKSTNLMASKIC